MDSFYINAIPTPKRSSQANLAQARGSVDELKDIDFIYFEGELFCKMIAPRPVKNVIKAIKLIILIGYIRIIYYFLTSIIFRAIGNVLSYSFPLTNGIISSKRLLPQDDSGHRGGFFA